MNVVFPISGVEIFPLWPPLVALVISFFTSIGGVSGAFLLLPFQVSVLGFTSPAVSSTNMVFNIVAIPSGVYRYIREGRMCWPLAAVIIMGTLPGVFLGFYLRVRFLPDPRSFKVFVACVLLYIGGRLFQDILKSRKTGTGDWKNGETQFFGQVKTNAASADLKVKTLGWSWRKVIYEFCGETLSFNVPGIFLMALAVGVIGGTYGIGGGAIIAPFLISVFGLPAYTVAGAALLGTFLTSVVGVAFYSLIGPVIAGPGTAVSPDWMLGGLFGLGGFAGMYLGARCQKFIPARLIKIMLALMLLVPAVGYIVQYFRG